MGDCLLLNQKMSLDAVLGLGVYHSSVESLNIPKDKKNKKKHM